VQSSSGWDVLVAASGVPRSPRSDTTLHFLNCTNSLLISNSLNCGKASIADVLTADGFFAGQAVVLMLLSWEHSGGDSKSRRSLPILVPSS